MEKALFSATLPQHATTIVPIMKEFLSRGIGVKFLIGMGIGDKELKKLDLNRDLVENFYFGGYLGHLFEEKTSFLGLNKSTRLIKDFEPDALITSYIENLGYFKNKKSVLTDIEVFWLPHGISPYRMEGIVAADNKKKIDYFLLPGQYFKKQLIRNSRGYIEEERIKIIGFPKLDNLVSKKREKDGVRDNKTILYAPTWAKHGSFSKKVVKNLIKGISKFDGYNLIIKPHESLFHRERKWRKTKKWMKKEAENNRLDLKATLDPDIRKYLLKADILVSDVSSVVLEYSVLDKPIILLKDVPEKDKLIDIGIKTYSKNIVSGIQEAIENNQKYKEKRENWIRKALYKADGRSAKRAFSKIKKLTDRE